MTLIEVLKERVHLIEEEGLWVQWPEGRRIHTRIPITANVNYIISWVIPIAAHFLLCSPILKTR